MRRIDDRKGIKEKYSRKNLLSPFSFFLLLLNLHPKYQKFS
jgi:hypothetical protein